ncbi:MAG: CRISPR-associated endonuclease Cas3'', partial [Thermoproteota archaeon]
MTVYSYVDREIRESMAEHAYLTLKIYLLFFGERYERILAKKTSSDINDISIAVRSAYLFHDVGKALVIFQERCKNPNSKNVSFKYHEAVSACLTYKVLSEDIVKTPLSMAVALAVLQHHQAMRNFIETLKNSSFDPSIQKGIVTEVVEELYKAVEMLGIQSEYDRVLSKLNQVIGSFNFEEYKNLVREMEYWIKNDFREVNINQADGELWSRFRCLIPMFSVPLQLSDTTAATLLRKGEFR